MPSLDPSSAAETRPLAVWLRGFVVTLSLVIVAVAAMYQFNARETLLAKSEVDARMLANSLSQHATDTFEIADVLLATLAERLKASPGRSLDDIYILNTALETQVRSVVRIRSLIGYDRAGKQFASSQPQVPDWFDIGGDEAFRFHKETFDDAIRIGHPVRSPTTNDWLLTVTRRWNDANGQFGGIVMATIRVDYFSNFYRAFNVSGEAGISLLDGNGTLLSRYPLDETKLGKNYSGLPWFAETQAKSVGALRFTSPVDGVARVHGYERTEQIPLLMFVGISEASILQGWLQSCIIMVVEACVLAALLGFVGWRFAAQVHARQLSERRWSDLALTDALTGVRNRRAFDEILPQEWGTASRHRRPLSILLVDVDHFKAFNDTYGHPAGDVCLRAIADALGKSLNRPGDCVARYGGEEFALLLSDTGPAGALVIAERVRHAVLMLGIAHSASRTLPLVSISIGVATETFGKGAESAERLVERADQALYRAKAGGRNRVEMAPADASSAGSDKLPMAQGAA